MDYWEALRWWPKQTHNCTSSLRLVMRYVRRGKGDVIERSAMGG